MDSDEAQASQNKGGLGRMNQMDGAVVDCSSNSLEQAEKSFTNGLLF